MFKTFVPSLSGHTSYQWGRSSYGPNDTPHLQK